MEITFMTPDELLALFKPPEPGPEAIKVHSTGDEIPLSDMEAVISANGQMPPLPPLLPDDRIRALSDEALSFLARVASVAATAFAHLRQKADFDEAMRQIIVLERHMYERRGDPQGELH